MAGKRKSRELALQILFVWDANSSRDDVIARQVGQDHSDDATTREAALALAGGAWDARPTIDPWVQRVAPQWPTRRQPGVDRNILRIAIHEITSGQTPPKVAIDEAIELAKTWSTENSPAFVNGVLDAVLKEHEALTANPNEQTRAENS